jgi:predicted GNAT family N-acyltransferase
MSAVTIDEISFPAEFARAAAIRRRVFVEEQAISEALEFDDLDQGARHLLATIDGEPAGTLRIRLLDDGRVAKIERVAVLEKWRRYRIGRALMEAALELAITQGAHEAKVHAQTVVQAFYAGLGFLPLGGEFEEDGIAHIAMKKPLVPEATTAMRAKPGP